MKLIIVLLSCLLIASTLKAQDTLRIDRSVHPTSFTFQPLLGFGYFNGGRVGVGVKLNEIVAVEAGVGLDFVATIGVICFFIPYINSYGRSISEGIIFTPFKEKRLSFMVYNSHSTDQLHSVSVLQTMIGWKIQTGESAGLRICAGYANRYAGEMKNYNDIHGSLDIVFTYDAFKVWW